MKQTGNYWARTKAWISGHKKTTAVIAVVLVIVLYIVLHKGASTTTLVTDTVTRRDLRSTVLATGDVTSTTDLNLSFSSSGNVSVLRAKVGDKVTKGQLLAMVSNQNELGNVTQAQGALKSAQAALDKTLEGATSEQVAVAQTTLSNAQVDLANTTSQQAILLANAKTSLLNAGLAVKVASGTTSSASIPVPALSGTYVGTEGTYVITTHNGSGSPYVTFSGIETGTAQSNTTTAVPLGKLGLYLTFPQGFGSGLDQQYTIMIPNTESPSYVTASNAYNAAVSSQKNAIASAQSAVDAAQANLNLQKAAARPSDVAAAQANVLSAQGRLQSAQAAYNNTLITAPADGTITSVDIKVGELATAQKEVFILQDVSNLYLEANINESDVGSVALGQTVEVTFDALGPDKKFTASVTHIDPAGTVVSGVVNYKIEAQVAGDTSLVKPGMTANMTIVTQNKQQVLVVPTRAVVSTDKGTIVRRLTDVKNKKYAEVPVTVGIAGDDGTEIISGLSEGDTIVTLSSADSAAK